MTNLLDTLTETIKSELKFYGVTEVFVIDGELHTTSDYTLPNELIEEIESILIQKP